MAAAISKGFFKFVDLTLLERYIYFDIARVTRNGEVEIVQNKRKLKDLAYCIQQQ